MDRFENASSYTFFLKKEPVLKENFLLLCLQVWFLGDLKNRPKNLYIAFFYLTGGEAKMKKGDKEMGVWGLILVPVILSGFVVEFEVGIGKEGTW